MPWSWAHYRATWKPPPCRHLESEIERLVDTIQEASAAARQEIVQVHLGQIVANVMNNEQGLRILIVDDERFTRSTIKMSLRAIGQFNISEGEDGETALHLVGIHKPDLVFCDIGMEPMSGLQFVERLRNHPDHALRDIAVVMVTALADGKTVQNAARLEIKGYLIKPVSPKQLGDRLHAIFQGYINECDQSNRNGPEVPRRSETTGYDRIISTQLCAPGDVSAIAARQHKLLEPITSDFRDQIG